MPQIPESLRDPRGAGNGIVDDVGGMIVGAWDVLSPSQRILAAAAYASLFLLRRAVTAMDKLPPGGSLPLPTPPPAADAGPSGPAPHSGPARQGRSPTPPGPPNGPPPGPPASER